MLFFIIYILHFLLFFACLFILSIHQYDESQMYQKLEQRWECLFFRQVLNYFPKNSLFMK